MHVYILECKVLDEGVMTLVVSALLDVLKDGEDVNLIVSFPQLDRILIYINIFWSVSSWVLIKPLSQMPTHPFPTSD